MCCAHQVPSVLVLVAGLMLVLVPVHMSDLVLQVVSRCDIPLHHQQYVMATVSTTILRETGAGEMRRLMVTKVQCSHRNPPNLLGISVRSSLFSGLCRVFKLHPTLSCFGKMRNIFRKRKEEILCQYLVPLITLWTMELVLLIVYPGVKQFVMAGTQILLQASLDHYR